jgi:NAD(P)-dependent dehydrogenase (short-subunit alcohol dehydrogenase family)
MTSQVLQGKTALVTGAGQGIGWASALALAQDGARVVITGRREEALVRARDEIRRRVAGASVETFVGDACEEAVARDAVAFGHGLADRLDILVTAVGGPNYLLVTEETAASARESYERNFMSMFLAVHHALPKMQRGGAVVAISTCAVSQAFRTLALYAATKAAVERFVKAAAYELGEAGIRINAVRPGFTVADELVEPLRLGEIARQYAEAIPLGRIGKPDDLARVVRFLAGPESGWVTGQIISVDGGQDQAKAPELVGFV